jgi:2-polyprenyl-3-methyl-5-hydroxy-6-metoxy-1,4-benzoquinol methylase
MICGGLYGDKMQGVSYPFFKKEICEYLKQIGNQNDIVLDIGAGAGIYADFLNKYFIMEAVEIFLPNIEINRLKEKYQEVYNQDIRDFVFNKKYKIIIMGDILEHLSQEDSLNILQKCKENCEYLMVAIPYNYKQGILYGNKSEIHIQDDLTDEIFNSRYPGFNKIYGNEKYGYYIIKT